MAHFLVFAGTSEGRRLIEWLDGCGASVCASVATAYGKLLLPENVQVFADRLDADEMTTLLQSLQLDCVIDATHPYAALVTGNIRAACAAAGVRCLRLSRPESAAEGCVYVADAFGAAEVIAATKGNVLLTTGSKELDIFTRVPDYQERIFPRVLPTIESVQRCLALGYRVQNLIAMQGPFTREMNCATLRQIGADILVTKESGGAGGFPEKLDAAHDTGATAIVIGRPREDTGLPYDELTALLQKDYGLSQAVKKAPSGAAFFPLFANLSETRAAVFGGGAVAYRRAAVLQRFCREVTVISPQISPEMEQLGVTLIRRTYLRGDCAGFDLVLAATNNREVNHAVYEEAKTAKIPANVADAPEECTFFFPGVAQKGKIVIGVTASGAGHHLARAVTERIRERISELVPEEERPHDEA
ncbi:precorrin-6A reductase [Anaerotruncus rubiinfantis]|uniref:precorrin-6A reductase n=1 Tax=Anaerotruncus rubiinfantis TaxID=1720200 RepID=UPI001899C2CC|nr:precorrin-6A reductase [Anaerotruncus rubiinfantis]